MYSQYQSQPPKYPHRTHSQSSHTNPMPRRKNITNYEVTASFEEDPSGSFSSSESLSPSAGTVHSPVLTRAWYLALAAGTSSINWLKTSWKNGDIALAFFCTSGGWFNDLSFIYLPFLWGYLVIWLPKVEYSISIN